MTLRWLEEISDAQSARATGVILTFNTADRVHGLEEGIPPATLKYALAQHFSREGYCVGYYATGTGFDQLTPLSETVRRKGPSPFGEVPNAADPAMVLTALGRVLHRAEPPVVLILDYADYLAPQAAGMSSALRPEQVRSLQILHQWGLDDDIRATRNLVVLISYENAVSTLLTQAGSYRTIRMDLPDLASRESFAEFLIEVAHRGTGVCLGGLMSGFSVGEFARTTGGLRLLDIEALLRRSGGRGEPVSREDVRRVKQKAIAQLGRELIEVVEPEQGFESVAGARHAKEYFELIRAPWLGNAPSVPQAVLLAGVPGCGKSHLVKALAKELEVPLLVMRGVREAWVGASERNLETVLWITENLAPCVLWTDEVDQVVGQRGTGPSGDSGTNERLVARIFEFFGSMEHRGRVLWVATTNRPDLLDPALLDRFQVVIPFLHPTRGERAGLLPLLTNQIGRTLSEEVDVSAVAALPALERLTVRSLQEVLVLAGLRGDAHDGRLGGPIQSADLIRAVEEYKPTYDVVEHEFIALTAIRMTPFATLMPWMGQTTGAPTDEWPDYLASVVDPETGLVSAADLEKKLQVLAQRRHLGQAIR